MTILETCKAAKDNVMYPANLSTEDKDKMLGLISDALIKNAGSILLANKKDVEEAKSALPKHMIDRLTLNVDRIKGMAKGVSDLIKLKDPIGSVLESWENHAGLVIMRVRVPLGVIGIIYEARPNVTSDTIALCIKTGNAIVLRGSKDAINTNKKIVLVIKNVLEKAGYNSEFIQLIEDTTRDGVQEFMRCSDYIDVLVPRGSAQLIKSVKESSKIPVIETGAGNCHEYIEKTADYAIAKEVLLNGKLQRPSVCNALESLLIDDEISAEFLPKLLSELDAKGVVIHGCEKTAAIYPKALRATEDDYAKEYSGLEISVRVVNGLDEAIRHINKYSTHHSETIITNDSAVADKFLRQIDSASVYVNASTRFTDGGEFGFGAELGISTQKLHTRGPIGPEQLTSYKYQIIGNGQIRK